MPKFFHKLIISLQINFFSSGNEDKITISTVKYSDIKAPKELGGLGVGNLKLKNLDL